MTIREKRTAENLLKIKAVFLRPNDPFTWASGILSPIYCDNRMTLAYPEIRKQLEHDLADAVKEFYPECEVLMGTSTAGIPHAAIISEILNLPMGYVRAKDKDHGRQNRIEGAPVDGKKVVVIEDLISTGGSSIDTVIGLREAGADVLGIISIYTYNMKKGIEKLKEANCENYSLTNLDTLADVAVELKYITEKEKQMLLTFRDNPSDISWRN